MAWKESHKQQSRQRILSAAAELFIRKGFNQVGIDEVMQAAGMTRGAFYAHFSSKSELYEEAIVCAGTEAAKRFSTNISSLDELINNYLSPQHFSSTTVCCPLPCLVSDMAHENEQVKKTYTKMYKKFTSHLGAIDEHSYDAEELILKSVLLIGGMAIARSVTDEALSKEILKVCSKAAKQEKILSC